MDIYKFPYEELKALKRLIARESQPLADDVTELSNIVAAMEAATTNIKYVAVLADFPEADISNEIHLLANTVYLVTDHVDLTDKRLVADGICAVVGVTSETSSLTSTNVSAMIESQFTLPMQNISLTAPIAIALSGATSAYDFHAVNFVDCPDIGTVSNADNFIFTNGTFLNSGGLKFDGTIGTIAFSNSLFNNAAATTAISLLPACTVTRRFRIIYSSFITLAGEVSLDIDVTATIPDEAYILDTVNFAGGGTYIVGVDDISNKALFINCRPIENTRVNGQLYMNDNAVATVVGAGNTWYKVLGTTLPSADNRKYLHTNNRLTNDAVIERTYHITCTLSFNAGNNNVCKFGFYDSKLGAVRVPSMTKSTANSGGRAENVTMACVVKHKQLDYLEIHCMNTTGAVNITVTDLNFVITEV